MADPAGILLSSAARERASISGGDLEEVVSPARGIWVMPCLETGQRKRMKSESRHSLLLDG